MLNKILYLLFVYTFLCTHAFGQSKKIYVKETGENDYNILDEKFRDAKMGDVITITTVKPKVQNASSKDARVKLQTFEEVKEYLENYFEENSDESFDILDHVSYLEKIFNFDRSIKGEGLRQFIFSNAFEEIKILSEALIEIDAQKTAVKLNEIALIYSKFQKGEELSLEERTAFENCEVPFKVAFEEEVGKMDEYVKRNLSEIILEIDNLD